MQILAGEALQRGGVEALAEFLDAGLFESDADGLAVAAEAHEDVGDGGQRVEQVERGNGAAGALHVAGASSRPSTMVGRWYSSTMRLATIPTTPRCQSGL